MFTQAKVRTVADYAAKISGRTFGLSGVGGDLGSGVRYIDVRRQLVWLGPRGARQAASYYLGVVDAFNHGVIGDLPEDVNAVRAELVGNGWNQRQYDDGASEANSFMQYSIERHDFSLAALQAMPVISQGHFDNVVFNSGGIKISLSRMTVADGAPYDHQVTVQKIKTEDGRNNWVTVREYEAK